MLQVIVTLYITQFEKSIVKGACFALFFCIFIFFCLITVVFIDNIPHLPLLFLIFIIFYAFLFSCIFIPSLLHSLPKNRKNTTDALPVRLSPCSFHPPFLHFYGSVTVRPPRPLFSLCRSAVLMVRLLFFAGYPPFIHRILWKSVFFFTKTESFSGRLKLYSMCCIIQHIVEICHVLHGG